MASPNHKAGLAVVVPASDNRSQPRGIVKQNAFSSPRKPPSQPSNMSTFGQSQGTPPAHRYSNGSPALQQPNGISPVTQPNGVLSSRNSPNGAAPQRCIHTGHQQPYGAIPQPSPGVINSQPKGVVAARPKLLGVEEALQYSPFSSIVPFNSDIIPIPNASLPGSPMVFPTASEQCTARSPLEYLNEELSKSGQSGLAYRVRNDLKQFLNEDVITDFKFKHIREGPCGQRHADEKKGGPDFGQPAAPKVSPFASIMLEATDLAHRYPTPTSPGQLSQTLPLKPQNQPTSAASHTDLLPKISKPQQSIPVPDNQTRKIQQQSPVTPTTQANAYNNASYSHNTQLSAKNAYTPIPAQIQPTPRVVIPPPSAEAHRSDFVTYEEPLDKNNIEASRKRKREGETHLGASLSQTRDQRATSDAIFLQFQDLVQDIFEAEDQFQLNGSNSIPATSIQYFVSAFHEDREVLTLSPAIHVRLESLLHKLINARRFEDVPIEQLQRLQRLCEGSLISAESSSMHIDPNCDAEGFAPWVLGLDAVDAGLRSARTVLRMMTGGREEKQLYGEELMQTLLGVVKRVLDNLIIPIVEARSSGPTSTIFEGVFVYKKVISQLMFEVNKVMALLAKLLAKVEMAEIIVTSIEFFATPLLFVENAASEKDSILGVQRFESLRRTAMDQISAIFSRYQEQRIFLLKEILTSLQKLPVNEKHARHYKLAEGKSIMLVSALIMQLVQISAKQPTAAKKKPARRRKSVATEEQEHESTASDEKASERSTDPEASSDSEGPEDNKPPWSNTATQTLSTDANLLLDNATKSAQYVTTYLVQRASNTTKTSESPHRQHLDMFVQDLIAVLSVPEWPAAELLLRMIFASCRNIAETPKSLAPAKNMALELLGMMGSAISDLVSNTRHASRSLENEGTEFSGYLRQMLDDYMDGSLESSELVLWDGPYHAVVEYLERNKSDDLQSASAQGYYLAQWAKAVSSGDVKANPEGENLISKLQKMLSGAAWANSDTLSNVTISQSRLAYALTVLSMDFCRQSDYILKILLDSITSEQISVRTRSLKSVDKMLEGDPSVLDRARNVKILITNCANDASPMVRESALTLIGKCITLRPPLEHEFLRLILRLTDDPAVGIRKRSIKMLKDIYLRSPDQNVKTAIGDSLLQRVKDLDTSVADLARQTFEDIWLSPFWVIPELADASAQNKVDLRNQIKLIVGTVRRGEKVAAVLAQLLRAVFNNNGKNAVGNFKVCKALVATAFDMMIDNFEDAHRLEQRHILQTLTVFATANAKLFTPDQLQSLQPYITNLSGKDDLDVFRSIVIIFRCVLPVQSSVQHKLLQDLQRPLLQSVPKLGRAELNEVAECLWTINGTLQNPEMLLRLVISVLQNLKKMRDKNLSLTDHVDDLKRVKKYIQIAGYFGKHCDFESHLQKFQATLNWSKVRSVAEMIVQSISPFTASVQPLSLKAEAFDSIGLICQSWPYQFTQEHISNAFQDVLRSGEPELQTIVLSSFRDFFARIDRQTEAKTGEALAGVNGSSASGEKLGGSMTANEGDGASALIAQRFLKDILRIALASQDASALTATEVIASINRQGLVHPKESGPALVALETSTNLAISNVASQEHRLLHQQHESMFEREYMRAIQEAFRYQRDVVGDTLGYTTRPYASKLSPMFDIIKTSKSKYQKKFLTNFCSRIDFDLSKMDLLGAPPNVLQFSRFLTENLAFFDYGRLDELLHTISCMEKIVADTGSGIAHSISTEVFNITVASMPEATVPNVSQDQTLADIPKPSIDPLRLYQLTTASVILCSLWETRTYLRRLYGQSASQQRREGKTKAAAKDLNKAPSKAQGVTGDKLVVAIAEKVESLGDENSMKQQCKDFVELLSIDSEVKVAAEGEESSERLETPSGDDEQDTPMRGRSQGVKRKSSVSITGTPMKKKGRPSVKRRKSGKSIGSDEDWD